MTEDEKLKRDIETMRESIDLDIWELSLPHKTPSEKAAIRKHVAACMAEITALKSMLGAKKT